MSALPFPTFGSLLRQHRLAARLTQEELAERSGLSPRAIIALEGGERRRPYRQTIELLASALQLSEYEIAMLKHAAGYSGLAREATPRKEAATPAPLVGRSRELSTLATFLDRPGPIALIFAGEPGIGKSRLLDEAAEQARTRGFAVVRGGGHRRSGQEPYAPMLDALSRSVNTFPIPGLEAALSGCRWLARLLPELLEMTRTPLPSGQVPPEQERRLMYSAAARYLTNIAGPSGTLLILDDLQWASPDGLDLISSVLRAEGAAPIRLIAGYRDTEVGLHHPVSSLLAELAERDLAVRVAVQPLAPNHVAELLDALLADQAEARTDTSLREEIARRAGGLPFFLVSYAHGLTAPAAGHTYQAVPWNVSQSVRQRVAALPVAARQVIQVAAVAGRVLDRRTLIGSGAVTEVEALVGLDAACQARLLISEGGGRYRFAHDVVKEVVEDDLGSAQRVLLHRRVGEALEQRPENGRSPAELAWHFIEADVPEKALSYSLLAGEAAASALARTEAAAHFQTAARLAREVRDTRGEAEALEKLGLVFRSAGHYHEAFQALERAADIQRAAGNLENEGRIATKLGWVLSQLGNPAEGVRRLEAVAERFEREGPSPALVGLYETLGHLYARGGRIEDRLRAEERAAEVASRLTGGAVRLRGEVHWAAALVLRGRYDDALPVLESLIQAAEEMGDSDTLAEAIIHAAIICTAQGLFDRARGHWEHLIRARQQTHSPDYVASAKSFLGNLLFVMGDWKQARANYDEGARLTSTLSSHQAGWVRLSLARLSLVEGKWQDADRYMRESSDIVQRTEDWANVPTLGALAARRDLLYGKADAAAQHLEPFLPTDDPEHEVQLLLAEAYIDSGNHTRAMELVRVGSELARQQNNRLVLPGWLRVEGMLLMSRRQWEEAEAALDESISLGSALPYPYALAQSLLARGRMRVAQGRPAEARCFLEEAHVTFTRLGARPFAERAERTLRALTSSRSGSAGA